jgi:hypothetical protein
MHEAIRGRAKRVLVIGPVGADAAMSPDAVLAPDGMMILMGQVAPYAVASGRRFVISGDPKRMLYKLAGPFDAIFCSSAYLPALNPMLDKLLAPDGVLITNDRPQ